MSEVWRDRVKLPLQDRVGVLEARVSELQDEVLRLREELRWWRTKYNCLVEANNLHVF